MKSTTVKEIAKLRRKIASLELKAAHSEVKRKKTALQKIMAVIKKYGFATLAELTLDAKNIVHLRTDAPKRAKVTDELRKAIIADLKKGADSALAIAKRHGVSQPTVNNIKKAAGLTKSKKVKAAPKTAARFIKRISHLATSKTKRAAVLTKRKITAAKKATPKLIQKTSRPKLSKTKRSVIPKPSKAVKSPEPAAVEPSIEPPSVSTVD